MGILKEITKIIETPGKLFLDGMERAIGVEKNHGSEGSVK